MATATQLFQDGKLSEALDAATQAVKAQPTDGERRTLLFELLCFVGDLDRADKQLDVIAQQNVDSEWPAQVYHNILAAERSRRRLFSDGLKPGFLLDPPAYIDKHLAAINRLREGHVDEARQLLDEAADQRPELTGQCKNEPFAGFCNCDDVLAPVLEFIVLRDYVWLPLEQVRELEVSRPERPRDLIWIPARAQLADGSQRRGYLPVLYVDSHRMQDDQLRLGRMTDWQEDAAGTVRGVGQQMFLVGEQAPSLLELGSVFFEQSASDGPSA